MKTEQKIKETFNLWAIFEGLIIIALLIILASLILGGIGQLFIGWKFSITMGWVLFIFSLCFFSAWILSLIQALFFKGRPDNGTEGKVRKLYN